MARDELEGWAKSLLGVASNLASGEELVELMGEVGTELRSSVRAVAKRDVDKLTGNYHKSIKKGRVWNKKGSISVNVYSDAPHAHLIEKGHNLWSHGENTGQYVEGKYVFERAQEDYEPDLEDKVDNFLNGVIKELTK